MNDTITWVNAMGYGDAHWHCQYLTKLGGSHILHCRENHHEDLRGMFPAFIQFEGMNNIPDNAIDCWIGTQCEYSWHSALCERDLIKFLGETWFEGLSRRIGVSNPIRNREDMLYDCPITITDPPIRKSPFFINASPRSGQVEGFDEAFIKTFNDLIPIGSGATNKPSGEQLGSMLSHSVISQIYPAIAGFATGPVWPCISKQNKGVPTYLLLTQVELNYGPDYPLRHFSTVADMAASLKEDGWL